MSTKNCRTCRVFVEKILHRFAALVTLIVIPSSCLSELCMPFRESDGKFDTWLFFDDTSMPIDTDLARMIVHTGFIGSIVVLCSLDNHNGEVGPNPWAFLSFPVVGIVFWLSNDAYLIIDTVFFWIKVVLVAMTFLFGCFILLLSIYLVCIGAWEYLQKLWQESVKETEEGDDDAEEHQNINKDVDLETPEQNDDI